jgi:hypothetical protein
MEKATVSRAGLIDEYPDIGYRGCLEKKIMSSGEGKVKLRLIRGGKEGQAPENQKIRLFSAYSMVDDFKGYDRVRLNWVCLERRSPLAPYSRLIEGYAQIGEQVRPFFEQYAKELFTEDEIGLLGSHLQGGLGVGFTANEELIPLPSVFIPRPFRQIKPGGPMGFFKPAGGGVQGLPFDFCGYYDLSRCPPSLVVQPEAVEKGVEFLRESLRELGIDPAGYEPLLKPAVEKVYDERGLMVDRGKNRKERIRERSQFFRVQAPPEH